MFPPLPHEDPCWGRAGEVGRGSFARALLCMMSSAEARVVTAEAPLVLHYYLHDGSPGDLIPGMEDGDHFGSLLHHHSAFCLPLPGGRNDRQPGGEPGREHLVQKGLPLFIGDCAASRPVSYWVKMPIMLRIFMIRLYGGVALNMVEICHGN